MKKCVNTINLNKSEKFLTSLTLSFTGGQEKKKFPTSEHTLADFSTTLTRILSRRLQTSLKTEEKKSAIAESLLDLKSMILTGKKSSSEKNTLITELSATSDQASTLKETGLKPFWTKQSKDVSARLYLPIKTGLSDLGLTSSSDSYTTTQEVKSWFSIKKLRLRKKNSLTTSFQLSQFSLPESTGYEHTLLKEKSEKIPPTLEQKKEELMKETEVENLKLRELKELCRKKKLPVSGTKAVLKSRLTGRDDTKKTLKGASKNKKTMKFRILPTKDEEEVLARSYSQFRWYYNASLDTLNKYIESVGNLKNKKISYQNIRDNLRKYVYNSEKREFEYDEKNNTPPIPFWWSDEKVKPHSRIIRGAADKLASSRNSAVSNRKGDHYTMSFMSSKEMTECCRFDDVHIPQWLKSMKSRFWYTGKDRRRKIISFDELVKDGQLASGVELIHDKITDRHFIHCPVDLNYFPEGDRRCERQTSSSTFGSRVISLDPGLRKFLTGYDPEGNVLFVGGGSERFDLLDIILEADSISSRLATGKNLSKEKVSELRKIRFLLNQKIRWKVDDMHWKTINYLTANYDVIMMPFFGTKDMVKIKRKVDGTKKYTLSRRNKRIMLMFSFCKFRERLKWKCDVLKKKLFIVTEEYTSVTCGNCGSRKKSNSNEVYDCKNCETVLDRDVNGARNILIKNIRLAGAS